MAGRLPSWVLLPVAVALAGGVAYVVTNAAKEEPTYPKPGVGAVADAPSEKHTPAASAEDDDKRPEPPLDPVPPLAEVDELPAERNLLGEHYPASNERRIDLFRPRIENLGGGYVGVGTDQNLTFIAWARSSHAWLMDFDAVVVATNRIHFALIEASATAEEMRAHWDPDERDATYALLKAKLGDDPAFEEAWAVAWKARIGVPTRWKDLDSMSERFGLRTFTNDPKDYAHLRAMVTQGRITAVPGDLKGSKTLLNIARSAEQIGVPIRVLYLSNAEEYMRYPQPLRDNILVLPIDDDGKVIRTATKRARSLGYPKGEKSLSYPFHYNVQTLSSFKAWMRFERYLSVSNLLLNATALERGLSELTIGPEETALKETGNINWRYPKRG